MNFIYIPCTDSLVRGVGVPGVNVACGERDTVLLGLITEYNWTLGCRYRLGEDESVAPWPW